MLPLRKKNSDKRKDQSKKIKEKKGSTIPFYHTREDHTVNSLRAPIRTPVAGCISPGQQMIKAMLVPFVCNI